MLHRDGGFLTKERPLAQALKALHSTMQYAYHKARVMDNGNLEVRAEDAKRIKAALDEVTKEMTTNA